MHVCTRIVQTLKQEMLKTATSEVMLVRLGEICPASVWLS